MWLNSFCCGSTDLTAAFFELQVIEGAAAPSVVFFPPFMSAARGKKGEGANDVMQQGLRAWRKGWKSDTENYPFILALEYWNVSLAHRHFSFSLSDFYGILEYCCSVFTEQWSTHTHTHLPTVCACVRRLTELTDLPAVRQQRSAASALLEGLVAKQLHACTRVNTLHTSQNLSPLKAALSFILFLLSSYAFSSHASHLSGQSGDEAAVGDLRWFEPEKLVWVHFASWRGVVRENWTIHPEGAVQNGKKKKAFSHWFVIITCI